jgi:hypothetical protein
MNKFCSTVQAIARPTSVLQRVEPLPCNDREMGEYIRAVPAATDTNAKIELLCFLWPVQRCYKQGTRLDLVRSVREFVKRGLEPETEE